jgi:hypothetical protein
MLRLIVALVACSLAVTLAGCESLKSGLKQAVLMDYDQANNFRAYQFEQPIMWSANGSQTGVFGHAQDVDGFWATYLICNVRNAGSEATLIDLNVHKFYDEYQGKKFYYQPLQPYMVTSIPHGLPSNPQATPLVNDRLYDETQLGEDITQYNPSPTTYEGTPYAPHRFAIYVTQSEPGPLDITERISLRYEGHPNVLNPRNQNPVTHPSFNNPARSSDLSNTCRPQLN